MSNPQGCTSVEEWLARGGTITRERDDREPIVDGEFEWDLVGQAAVPRTYRCRRTGVLAHQRSLSNRITPYICRHHGCSMHGRHRGYGNATYCDEHNPGEAR